MAVNFRCDSCGKLLSFEKNPGQQVECPQCQATVAVPAALASLPQPKVAPNAKRPASPSQPAQGQAEGQVEEELVEEEESEELMGAVAAVMPIVMSVLLHLGLFVIFLFITFIVYDKSGDGSKKRKMVIQSEEFTEDEAGGVKYSGQSDPTQRAESEIPSDSKKWSPQQAETVDTGQADSQATLLTMSGGGSAGGDLAPAGLSRGGQLGPPGEMYGLGGNAHHRVFVIDASGSMVGALPKVKLEMSRQISKLKPSQTFHIVFFNDDLKDENPPRRLVDVTRETKVEAAEFLKKVTPGGDVGRTDPRAALRRAFQVLARADKERQGKQIFLLTDGSFHVMRKELLDDIKKMKTGQDVAIFTFLYGYRSPDPTEENSVESVLQAIAAESDGGKYKYVED